MAWSTTFYYGQELRSLYMNNMINGLIRPGIYNMDAAVIVVPNNQANKPAGIQLRLRAGTTFVFSNGYDSEGGRLVRNLDKVGSYIVKCVLQDDTDITLSAINEGSGIFIINGRQAPVLFVYAYFEYDDSSTSDTAPKFSLAVPSSNSNFATSYTLPNEDRSSGGETNISYLMIGALLDNGQQATPAVYAIASSGWNTNGDTAWLKNHVFTGRAFPDYKGGMFKTQAAPVPTLGFAPDYSKMYLTRGQFYYGSNLYEVSGAVTWKTLYGQGGDPLATEPTRITGFTTDHEVTAAQSTTYSYSAPTLTSNSLILEFLFMALNTEYARGDGGTLTSLLQSGFTLQRTLVPYRVVCSDPNSIEWDTSELKVDYGTNYSTVPLDISMSNQARLRRLVSNQNIILPVIDAIRQIGLNGSPYLDPTVGDTLLPIMVSIRQVDATGAITDAPSLLATGAVNPANVLSFFELQASSFAVVGVSLAAEETFATVPLID